MERKQALKRIIELADELDTLQHPEQKMERKQALKRIIELADELDALQQAHLTQGDTHEWFNLLQDMAEEAEVALDEEFGL